ncbi:MAG TPA: carbonic anhydrase [Rhizomicrobium sp.]|nr:carbonic anhydrase [Rhizomicrobium sp.]
MGRLIAGYRAFRDGRWQTEHERYVELARDGQRPETLVIACSDSRSDPATIFNARPGELFVVRNIAAIVPPLEIDDSHHGTTAAIAFAVLVLKVRNILVLGHAQCSGVAAALDRSFGDDVPFLRSWIDLLTPAVQRASPSADEATRHASLERDTVVLSMERLRSYPFIAERLASGELEINGARFGIADGKLEIFDPASRAFEAV